MSESNTVKSLTKSYFKDLTYQIIGAAIEVHKEVGAGLLESAYEECMAHELEERKVKYKTQVETPIPYKGKLLNTKYRCDLFVESCIVVELKAVVELLPIFDAQLITYMRLMKAPKGILLNFTCDNIYKNGQKNLCQ